MSESKKKIDGINPSYNGQSGNLNVNGTGVNELEGDHPDDGLPFVEGYFDNSYNKESFRNNPRFKEQYKSPDNIEINASKPEKEHYNDDFSFSDLFNVLDGNNTPDNNPSDSSDTAKINTSKIEKDDINNNDFPFGDSFGYSDEDNTLNNNPSNSSNTAEMKMVEQKEEYYNDDFLFGSFLGCLDKNSTPDNSTAKKSNNGTSSEDLDNAKELNKILDDYIKSVKEEMEELRKAYNNFIELHKGLINENKNKNTLRSSLYRYIAREMFYSDKDFSNKNLTVHHTDGDRSSSDAGNLVALEKTTHQNYHKKLENFKKLFENMEQIEVKLNELSEKIDKETKSNKKSFNKYILKKPLTKSIQIVEEQQIVIKQILDKDSLYTVPEEIIEKALENNLTTIKTRYKGINIKKIKERKDLLLNHLYHVLPFNIMEDLCDLKKILEKIKQITKTEYKEVEQQLLTLEENIKKLNNNDMIPEDCIDKIIQIINLEFKEIINSEFKEIINSEFEKNKLTVEDAKIFKKKVEKVEKQINEKVDYVEKLKIENEKIKKFKIENEEITKEEVELKEKETLTNIINSIKSFLEIAKKRKKSQENYKEAIIKIQKNGLIENLKSSLEGAINKFGFNETTNKGVESKSNC